jgi:mannosyltransferase
MIILPILFLGIVLRLINLDQSLWLDEAISTLAARDFSYLGIIFDFLRIDNHPPVFYLLLRVWGQVFGFTDINLRFLPVLLGTALIYVVYKIGLRFEVSKKTAATASILVSTSPLLVYFSQEVRMYILITLLCAAQIFVYLLIEKKSGVLKWVIFSLLNCLLFFSDYITVFFFPVFIFYPVLQKNFKLLKNTLIGFIPLLFLFLLWYPFFDAQLIKNKELVNIFPGWENIVGGATFKNLAVAWMKFVLGRISFEPKIIYYGLVGIFSIPLLYGLYLNCKNYKKYLLLWLWFFIPIASGFLFSLWIPVFNYFRFIYVLPAMLILTAVGLSQASRLVRVGLLGFLILGNITGLFIYYADPSQQRENWRQAVGFIEENASPGDVVVFEFFEPFAPYKWYESGKVDLLGATDSYYANEENTRRKLEEGISGKTGVFYFEYLRDLTDPQKIVEKKLIEEGFSKDKIINDFYNIGQVSYYKK